MQPKPNSILLLFFFSLAYVFALVISPALPAIAKEFGVRSGDAQLAFSIYIAGFAVAQLLYGPLANHFGRKKAMYIAVVMALVFSFLCLVSIWIKSFSLLVLFRFLQAIGACGSLSLTFIVVHDIFEGLQRARFIALFTVTFSIACFFGVFAGGWLIRFFSLTSIFYFCVVFCLLQLLTVMTFPDTRVQSTMGLKPKEIFKRYLALFSHKRFFYLSTLTGGLAGVTYFFNQSAPFIGINYLKMTSSSFGNWNSSVYIAIFLGALWVRFLMKYLKQKVILFINLICSMLSAVGLLLLFLLGHVTVITLFLPSALLFLFAAGLYPVSTSWALESIEDKEYGSALLSFLYVGISFIALLIAGIIHTKNPTQLPAILISIVLIMWALYFLAIKGEEKKTS